jgi:tetratricopeptide (TPR) repeat protein
MRTLVKTLVAAWSLAAACTAFGAGGGELPNRSSGPASRLGDKQATPEELAQTAYNAGVRAVEKGDELAADAARQTDPKKQQKLTAKAQGAYAGALKKFIRATELQASMHAAWNYVGYTNRKLGKYPEALAAYDRALALKPGYPEAIEYRGYAYLGLNRLSEAKEAYLTLFAGNRKLAATLLTAMQEWIGAHRGNSADVDGAMLESFASWVNERNAIASQTAALTREGAASAWH